MRIKLPLIGLFCLLFTQISFCASPSAFESDVARLRSNLDQICSDSPFIANNLVYLEQVLGQLMGANYPELLATTLEDKQVSFASFCSQFCNSSSASVVGFSIDLPTAIAHASVHAKRLSGHDFTNLVDIEYFLHTILGEDYRDLIRQSFGAKQVACLDSLVQLGGSGSGASAISGLLGAGAAAGSGTVGIRPPSKTLDISDFAPTLEGFDTMLYFAEYDDAKPDDGKDGVEESKGHDGLNGFNVIDYGDTVRHPNNFIPAKNNFYAAIGLDWDSSKLSRPKNIVEKFEYPDLNKYNQGYPAMPMIVLENNYSLFDVFVSQIIKDNLLDISPENIDFYVEISSGFGFYDKERRYNMIFHGAMADWYAADMAAAGFNFATGSFSKNLPMGIFVFNGIEHHAGDIAKNELRPKDVHVHNDLYSPDNAGFIIESGRHMVTFWSVAKSNEKNRAVVTFHILFDWDLQNKFKDRVLRISRDELNVIDLRQLLNELNGLSSLLGGDDQIAWQAAMQFLFRMYGVHL